MSKNVYTDEFKHDLVTMVKQGVSQRQIVKDFGVSKSSLSTWVHKAEREEYGLGASGNTDDHTQLNAALKRIRLLEQEAEVMRRAVAYFSQVNLPKN